MDKINYYNMMADEFEKIKSLGRKPKLLMHVCCGPCSTFPTELLTPLFDLTLHFNNSNIYPSNEYYRRLDELKKYLDIVNEGKIEEDQVKIIVTDYQNDEYNKFLSIRKDDKEGQQRCFMCYEKRMDEAMNYASINNFDYFTTVMTISRQKNSQKLNEIGKKLIEKYPNVKYLFSDFKKKKGINRKEELTNLYQMYRQQYCGCVYSYNEYLRRLKEKEEAQKEKEN